MKTKGIALSLDEINVILKEKYPWLPEDLQIVRVEQANGFQQNVCVFVGLSESFEDRKNLSVFECNHPLSFRP